MSLVSLRFKLFIIIWLDRISNMFKISELHFMLNFFLCEVLPGVWNNVFEHTRMSLVTKRKNANVACPI